MIDTITVKIMSPVALVWETQALSVSAENSEGIFDILPDHARFMTLIRNMPLTVELPDSPAKTFTFENAILFFEENTAVIYIQETLQKIAQ
jgi:F0F1-type ATP synthase epsilon subunit